MKFRCLLLFLWACVAQAHGTALSEPGGATPPEFELDKDLLNKLYTESISEPSASTNQVSGAIRVSPQLSWATPLKMTLSNTYFEIPYAENLGAIPFFHLSLSTPVGVLGELELSAQLKTGYSYKEGLYTVRSQTGLQLNDILKLHWVPVSLSFRLSHPLPLLTFAKLSLATGAGAQWLYQVGKLDGIEQGFWVPFYSVSPALILFDPGVNTDEWFGGLIVGASYQHSVASTQEVRYWSLDLGLNFQL